MLSARAEAFRQLSRPGDEALAVRDPAQRLPCRICAPRELAGRAIDDVAEDAEQTPLWREAQETPEAQMLRARDADRSGGWSNALAEPFRETFVLREINNLSYREIADVVEVPVGTVMSRLARARAMLRVGMDGGRGATEMTCDEAEILLHALIDGELDAGHAREVEDHIASCPRCAAELPPIAR